MLDLLQRSNFHLFKVYFLTRRLLKLLGQWDQAFKQAISEKSEHYKSVQTHFLLPNNQLISKNQSSDLKIEDLIVKSKVKEQFVE